MSTRNVVFVAGVHGAGKGYLCSKLAPQIDAQHVTASSLIRNRKNLGEVKAISGIDANQAILVQELIKFETTKSVVLLDGHFCLYNNELEIECLPLGLFKALNVKFTVLLTCNPVEIMARLHKRDQKKSEFSLEQVEWLQLSEKKQARDVSEALRIPMAEVDFTVEPKTSNLGKLSLSIKGNLNR